MESISSAPVRVELQNTSAVPNPAVLEWLTPSEAAAHLRVNTRTLLRWVRERTLKAYALSGSRRRIWRFLLSDLDAGLLQNCFPTQPTGEAPLEPRTRIRYLKGSVVLDKRNNTWHYLWRDGGHRRSKLIGTERNFPTKSSAWEKAEHLRLEGRSWPQHSGVESTVTVKSLTEAYRSEKMPTRIDTRRAYEVWLKHYILPRFGSEPISSVQSRIVELWLNELKLSPKSKVHIRGLLRILWDYAQWRGDVPTQRNPMELVSVKNASKRVHHSRSLTVQEFRKFVAGLDEPFALVASLCVSLGLRISEALALKWADFDSTACSVRVERAIVCQNVDEVKSTRSKKVLPLDSRLLAMVKKYHRAADYSSPEDWVFASPMQDGRLPLSYDQIWRVYQKAAKTAGIGGLGTHSLRHTYRSWLDAVGTSIAVQQKLMRHSDIRTTMNVYGDVVTDEMEVANKKVSRLALNKGKAHHAR